MAAAGQKAPGLTARAGMAEARSMQPKTGARSGRAMRWGIKMKHLRWPLAGFDSVRLMKGATPRVRRTRYPIRHLRYWFIRSALAELCGRLNRPLRVLEVGVDSGDMLCFMGGRRIADDCFALPEWIARWDGLDVNTRPAVLERYSYSNFINANIESPSDGWNRNAAYDAVVVLHVLE